jgi:hypothetical protein
MIPTRRAAAARSGDRFFLVTNAKRVFAGTMLKNKGVVV